MKPSISKFTQTSILAGAVALTFALPTTGFSASRLNDSTVGEDTDRSDNEKVEIFEGTIMSVSSYLLKDTQMGGEEPVRKDLTQDHTTTSARRANEPHTREYQTKTPGETSSTASEYKQTSRTTGTPGHPNAGADSQRWQADRTWDKTGSRADGGPLGLVVNKDGFLGIGSGSKFYLLISDPNDQTSREAFGRLTSYSRTGKFLNDTDRNYVKDPNSTADRNSTTGSARGNTANNDNTKRPDNAAWNNDKSREMAGDMAGHDQFVRVTGRIVERENVQAIIVQSVSDANRPGAHDVSDESDKSRSSSSNKQQDRDTTDEK